MKSNIDSKLDPFQSTSAPHLLPACTVAFKSPGQIVLELPLHDEDFKKFQHVLVRTITDLAENSCKPLYVFSSARPGKLAAKVNSISISAGAEVGGSAGGRVRSVIQ